MLDVYRNYYQLTGEPFRLGPDYRFSLHHASYANAKAYLEFAIYQGEGFIAITGGPGTGKTTLISEIMATLDRGKIEVATLSSTQLESRDLLQMVASSFGLHPEKISKTDLLLEIEAFLISRIRNGHRAILIVDEAQGLSSGALEELRLLANLQFQYQLLLQIVLIGQERLLELIHAPGMEHLQQRLVAATSLEPLDLDGTIDYIEHRLKRVAWKGDPAIDEDALCLIYRYSGGIPRRINLIANRLFLYGGMQEKHHFDGAAARSVIDGLIEEALLPVEPLIAETAIEESPAPDEQAKARHLPRDPETPSVDAAVAETQEPKAEEPKAEEPKAQEPKAQEPKAQEPKAQEPKAQEPKAQEPKARQSSTPTDSRLAGDSLPGSRRPPRDASSRVRSATDAAARSGRDGGPLRSDDTEGKTGAGKTLLILGVLLAGAAAGYLLYNASNYFPDMHSAIFNKTAVEQPTSPGPDLTGEPVAQADAEMRSPAEDPQSPSDQAPDIANDATKMPGTNDLQGQIIRTPDARAQEVAPTATGRSPETVAEPVVPAPAPAAAPAETIVATKSTPATGDDGVSPTRDDTDPSAAPPTPVPDATPTVTESVAALPAAEPATPSRASPAPPREPAPSEAAPQRPVPAPTAQAAESVYEQRARLKEAAEQRFSEQVARLEKRLDNSVTPEATPAPPPLAAAATAPTPEVQQRPAEPVRTTPPDKKKRFSGPNEIKNLLLQGRWYSSGKPASLLPSESTLCESRSDRIWCVSVPQNVKTQYGIALYKVETTLMGFSGEGHFEMAYRTLVKLVGAETPGSTPKPAATTDNGWQVTDYSMSCTLINTNQVSCLDDKGVTRRYLGTDPESS